MPSTTANGPKPDARHRPKPHADAVAMKESPDTVADGVERARVWARRLADLGRIEQARKVLAESMDAHPGSVAPVVALAALELRANEVDRAKELLGEALDRDPDALAGQPIGLDASERAAFSELAEQVREKRGEEAAAHVPRPETSDEVLEVIAWVEWLKGRGRLSEATSAISEAVATHGRDAGLLCCAAEVADASGTYNTALYFWREAYQEAPDDVVIVCGLAIRLARTTSKPSFTGRVLEAMVILSRFPDQSHPGIRLTRAAVLRERDASAARLVRAYGRAEGLPDAEARKRRRLWWRSAGPIGRLCIATVDALRNRGGAGWVRPACKEAESEAIARALDELWLEPLSDAAEKFEAALREHGRKPSLLLAYAESERSAGNLWHALGLACEVAQNDPDSLDAVCTAAWVLYIVAGYGIAIQVMRSLSLTAQKTMEARVITGDLHRHAGNHALAVGTYGDPRELNEYDRKSRRRVVRKALMRWPRRTEPFYLPAVDPGSLDVPEAVARAVGSFMTRQDEDLAARREKCLAAVEEHGRHPLLLLALADASADRHACAALAEEAIGTARHDTLYIPYGIRLLWWCGSYADAVTAVEHLPLWLNSSPSVRVVKGQIYRNWNLWGRAADALAGQGLPAYWRRKRRLCWWLGGGPLSQARARARSEENELPKAATLSDAQATGLSLLRLPEPLAIAVRRDVATQRMRLYVRAKFFRRIGDRWLDWSILPLGILITAASVLRIDGYRRPLLGTVQAIATPGIVVLAVAAGWWAVGKLDGNKRLPVAAASGLGAWALLHGPASQAAYDSGLILAALASLIAVRIVLAALVRMAVHVNAMRWQRGIERETAVLSDLLELLGQLSASRQRRDADDRRGWRDQLERVAVLIEAHLPFGRRRRNASAEHSLAEPACAAAAALREMQRAVAFPTEASWQDLIEQLTGLTTALATHDFANWPAGVAEFGPEPPRSRWKRAANALRVSLVIFVPPVVAYLLPRFVAVGEPGLSWLRLGAVVWALLGAVTTLDPNRTERLGWMRDALSFFVSVKSAGDGAGSSGVGGSPGQSGPDRNLDEKEQRLGGGPA